MKFKEKFRNLLMNNNIVISSSEVTENLIISRLIFKLILKIGLKYICFIILF